jgi:radical SAM protein (TIGR04043 family)
LRPPQSLAPPRRAVVPESAGDMTVASATTCRKLKLQLLSSGTRVSPAARRALKDPLRVRSGSCGGADLVLPDGSLVNAPVSEPFAASSPFLVDADSEGLFLERVREGSTTRVSRLGVVPQPAYYSETSSEGLPLRRIGQLCSDRLGVGMTNFCQFWRDEADRCRFCSIGLNGDQEERVKSLRSVLEVAGKAINDPIAPARHVLLGGGTPGNADGGAALFARVTKALKTRWDVPVYVMQTPPGDLARLELLRDAGVDEVGLNIEMFDETAAARLMPGKHRQIGLRRFFAALERAVELFGPINARSIMIVGLEAFDSTLAGVRELAQRGVMPILTPFRPMKGTPMEGHPRPDAEFLWDMTLAASEVAESYGIPLGPTCIPCQSNTLTPAGHPSYVFY